MPLVKNVEASGRHMVSDTEKETTDQLVQTLTHAGESLVPVPSWLWRCLNQGLLSAQVLKVGC